MAHKKATDYRYEKCTKEAVNIVKQWFKNNHLAVDPKSIYIVWFAYTQRGYHCMVASKMYQNNYFEVKKNVETGELICLVLQQVECIVHPSSTDELILHERTDSFDF